MLELQGAAAQAPASTSCAGRCAGAPCRLPGGQGAVDQRIWRRWGGAVKVSCRHAASHGVDARPNACGRVPGGVTVAFVSSCVAAVLLAAERIQKSHSQHAAGVAQGSERPLYKGLIRVRVQAPAPSIDKPKKVPT